MDITTEDDPVEKGEVIEQCDGGGDSVGGGGENADDDRMDDDDDDEVFEEQDVTLLKIEVC